MSQAHRHRRCHRRPHRGAELNMRVICQSTMITDLHADNSTNSCPARRHYILPDDVPSNALLLLLLLLLTRNIASLLCPSSTVGRGQQAMLSVRLSVCPVLYPSASTRPAEIRHLCVVCGLAVSARLIADSLVITIRVA